MFSGFVPQRWCLWDLGGISPGVVSFLSPSLLPPSSVSLSLKQPHTIARSEWILTFFFILQMMDSKTKISPLEIMFLSVQLVETGKAISMRQEPLRTDLERKYHPGLLEIEVPWCRLQGIQIILRGMVLLSERWNDGNYKGRDGFAKSQFDQPAETSVGLIGCHILLTHLTSWVWCDCGGSNLVPKSLHEWVIFS